MKPQSAKAKGRRLQQQFRELLIEELGIHPEDIESRSMGAGGEDLIMARAAREKFPYSIECKNVEKLNVWEAYKQAEDGIRDTDRSRGLGDVYKRQQFRELLIEELGVHPEDIESRSMGAGGEDLIMARAAREKFPYSIECKNVELSLIHI